MKSKKKDKKSKSFFKSIASSKGVYITLCSALAIVGFSIYSNHIRSNMGRKLSSFNEETFQETEKESLVEIIDIDSKLKEELSKTAPQDSAKKITSFETPPSVVEVSAAAAESAEPPQISMELPNQGEIISECSLDDLLYCASMNDWRTHNGIDIAGKIGDPVKASADGTVSEVYKDELLGVVVVLDHGNDISSVYANLQNPDFISVGTKVKKGDIIGGIGESGALETGSDPHLHFEVLSKGEYQDPKSFLLN